MTQSEERAAGYGESAAAAARAAEARTALSVTRGSPTAEELAALLVVLSSRAGAEEGAAEPARISEWSARWRTMRAPIRPGPGAWRASALPI